MIEILILSLIQGVAEFLPVSSSSHLILISKYFNFDNQNLSIDVSLHIGSFFAVVVFFREEIINFYNNKDLFFKNYSCFPSSYVGWLFFCRNKFY